MVGLFAERPGPLFRLLGFKSSPGRDDGLMLSALLPWASSGRPILAKPVELLPMPVEPLDWTRPFDFGGSFRRNGFEPLSLNALPCAKEGVGRVVSPAGLKLPGRVPGMEPDGLLAPEPDGDVFPSLDSENAPELEGGPELLPTDFDELLFEPVDPTLPLSGRSFPDEDLD